MSSSSQMLNPAFSIPRQNFFIPSPAALQAEIKSFVAKANNLADQILSQNEPKAYTGPVIIHDHHYYQPYPMFWYHPGPRYVVINNNPSDNRKKEDNSGAIIIGVISAIVAGVALYSLGSSIAAYQDTNEELADTHEFRQKLNSFPANPNQKEQSRIEEAYQVANLKGRICSRIKNSAISDIILKGFLFTAAGLSLAGAITTTPALMTGGVIAGLVATGGLLFKWGFDSTDKSNVRDAQTMKAILLNLN